MLQPIQKYLGLLCCIMLAASAQAQSNNAVPAATTESLKTETVVNEKTTDKPTGKSAPKTVQSASFNLGTTITGNQEQPKVLYILPWQSPQTENVDFESLENQQKSVFGHVEREELRRELESADDVQ